MPVPIGRENMSSQLSETQSMERIYIKPTDRVFVLTGAGMSAESGIPTFRDTNGLWRNYRVEEVASPDAWRRDPQLVWDFYSMRRTVAATAQPNPGHRALASPGTHSGLSSLSLHAERRQFARAGRLSSAPHARRVVQEPVRALSSALRRHEYLSRDPALHVWRKDPSAHLLVRRNAVWDGSCPAHSGSLHGLHCNRDFRDGRACGELRWTDQSPHVLRRPGGAAQPRVFRRDVHRQSRRLAAYAVRRRCRVAHLFQTSSERRSPDAADQQSISTSATDFIV
jgi:hypothetical protein